MRALSATRGSRVCSASAASRAMSTAVYVALLNSCGAPDAFVNASHSSSLRAPRSM